MLSIKSSFTFLWRVEGYNLNELWGHFKVIAPPTSWKKKNLFNQMILTGFNSGFDQEYCAILFKWVKTWYILLLWTMELDIGTKVHTLFHSKQLVFVWYLKKQRDEHSRCLIWKMRKRIKKIKKRQNLHHHLVDWFMQFCQFIFGEWVNSLFVNKNSLKLQLGITLNYNYF